MRPELEDMRPEPVEGCTHCAQTGSVSMAATMITTENLAEAFDEVAPSYDLMVALNPSYHAHLRAAADALVEWLPGGKMATSMRPESSMRPELVEGRQSHVHLVDLGCGSGASTRAVQQAAEAAGIDFAMVGVDPSAGMLEQAHAKRWPAGVRFEVGQAEEISTFRDAWGIGDPLHGIFAAYLFRNLADRDAVLAALFDLLADDGVLVVQEYSIAGSRRAQLVWTLACWLVIIPLGWLTSRRTRLYRYLWRSVRSFDSIQTFVDRLYRAGFTDVEVRTASGWQRGILHTFRARKAASWHS
jgi:ubiquinone/menaquinone biosynthesis C-methylase UbiE